MAKLYPPTIAGTIPAFCGTSIEVPFLMNRAVSPTDFDGFSLKMKKISGTVLGTIDVKKTSNNVSDGLVTFILPSTITSELKTGEFYKIQLAYSNGGSVGIYSTIGVVKYTTKPIVSIENLSSIAINNHIYAYTGVYRQKGADDEKFDTAEKLYSSRFYFYDDKGNIIKDSGEILHSTAVDSLPYEASESFLVSDDLPLNEIYYVQYTTTSINGLIVTSPKYKITQRRQIPMSLEASISAVAVPETGTIDITLTGKHKNRIATGQFMLSRRAVQSSRENWKILMRFSLQSEVPDRLLFSDHTVEQGVEYIYSLQQYNDSNVVSDRVYSNSLLASFDDIFLYDGERQLRVQFNPKVSSFKATVSENKVNTLGSKHPFISRNGVVNYKEFSIAGLISYQMDNMWQFMTPEELDVDNSQPNRLDTPSIKNDYNEDHKTTTNLTTNNIRSERDFKLEVLEWLNNGKPKLFRSPTEGNYIVRLMNISLTPMDQLGRMLHTFNCQAFEIAEMTDDNLAAYGLLQTDSSLKYQMKLVTIELASYDELTGGTKYFTGQVNVNTSYGENAARPVYYLSVNEMLPGTYFEVGKSPEDCQRIYIGATGAYEINVDTPYEYIGIPKEHEGHPVEWTGSITYGYRGTTASLFDLISNVQLADVPCRRFLGKVTPETIQDLQNVKTKILFIKYIKFSPRGYEPIYMTKQLLSEQVVPKDTELHFYSQMNNENYVKDTAQYPADDIDFEVRIEDLNVWPLYKIYWRRENYDYMEIHGEGYYVDREKDEQFSPFSGFYLDAKNRTIYQDDGNIFSVIYDGETSDISLLDELCLPAFDEYKEFTAGPGVITDMGYQTQTSTYSLEFDNHNLANLKAAYEESLSKYLSNRTDAGKTQVDNDYAIYINYLNVVLDTYRKEHNIKDENE